MTKVWLAHSFRQVRYLLLILFIYRRLINLSFIFSRTSNDLLSQDIFRMQSSLGKLSLWQSITLPWSLHMRIILHYHPPLIQKGGWLWVYPLVNLTITDSWPISMQFHSLMEMAKVLTYAVTVMTWCAHPQTLLAVIGLFNTVFFSKAFSVSGIIFQIDWKENKSSQGDKLNINYCRLQFW